MKVRWISNQCILCLREHVLCEEHLIPTSLGGKLACDFLCRDCNSRLGYDLEAKAKFDPSVVIAAKHMKPVIPALAASILDGHPYLGHSEPGPAKGYMRNGEFRVHSRKMDDGSLILSTKDARDSLIKKLQRSGFEEAPILSALEMFDQAPEDMRVEVVPGLEIAKWSVGRLELDLSGARLMDPLIPAKAAFEFLACHMGSAIYSDARQLSEIRKSLLERTINSGVIEVERLSANKYEPFHGIVFEGNNPHAIVQIRLFGLLTFRVHFRRLAVQSSRFVYTVRLDTGVEDVRIISEPE